LVVLSTLNYDARSTTHLIVIIASSLDVCCVLTVHNILYKERKYVRCVYRLGYFLSTLVAKLYHYFFTQTPQQRRHFSYFERRFMFHVDINHCPDLSAILSQPFPLRNHLNIPDQKYYSLSLDTL